MSDKTGWDLKKILVDIPGATWQTVGADTALDLNLDPAAFSFDLEVFEGSPGTATSDLSPELSQAVRRLTLRVEAAWEAGRLPDYHGLMSYLKDSYANILDTFDVHYKLRKLLRVEITSQVNSAVSLPIQIYPENLVF